MNSNTKLVATQPEMCQLDDFSDFEKLLSPSGHISICGFGSLLSERSARSTFPNLLNFRVAKLKRFRRVFAHVAPIFFDRGIAKPETKEFSSSSVEPCDGEALIVTVFDFLRFKNQRSAKADPQLSLGGVDYVTEEVSRLNIDAVMGSKLMQLQSISMLQAFQIASVGCLCVFMNLQCQPQMHFHLRRKTLHPQWLRQIQNRKGLTLFPRVDAPLQTANLVHTDKIL